MGSGKGREGLEDVAEAVGRMPSYLPSLSGAHAVGAEGNNMHASRVSAFGAVDQLTGFGVNGGADLRKPLLNTKTSGHLIASDSLQFGSFNKATTSMDKAPVAKLDHISFAPQKGQPTILAQSSLGQYENWGESNMVDNSPRSDSSSDEDASDRNQKLDKGQTATAAASDSSDRSKEKAGDQKTLRRLAQNREAARKSRLRKKAYVQQLENSRLKLTQIEQELQRARQQGIFISSTGDQSHSTGGNGALAFDLEYARWLEEHNRLANELRAAVNAHASDNDLRTIVDGIMAHYDEIFRLKINAAKSDVFHMLSGMWQTPAERCFLWLGGFRSSDLLKLLVNHLEPLTEQQLVGICNLQQSSQQAEDALSQGMDALQQSLSETLSGSLGPAGSSGNVANYMGQMAMAMGKLGTLESFLRQADNLRQQTLQQMHRILTTRQSARALLAISDYFSRLRALSSLWLARPRE